MEAALNKTAPIRRLPEEPWEKGIGPGIIDKKIMGPNDSNFMLMGIAKMEPGVHSPPHHHRYAQVFYFLEGHAQVVLDDQPPIEVGPGDVVRMIRGETHTVINPGPEPLTLLEVRVLRKDQAEWD
jgi:mannose-6-phosphate isomerase-like protein (cupin superfamily)